MKERDIEAYLVRKVMERHGEIRKVVWQGRRGAPDRLVGIPGTETKPPRSFWVELKAPGVAPEPHQVREHQRMQAIGLRVVVIDSIAGVDEVLR